MQFSTFAIFTKLQKLQNILLHFLQIFATNVLQPTFAFDVASFDVA